MNGKQILATIVVVVIIVVLGYLLLAKRNQVEIQGPEQTETDEAPVDDSLESLEADDAELDSFSVEIDNELQGF